MNKAHFDETGTAVVIDRLTLHDKDVAREAQRWTTGERGPIVDNPGQLTDADLTEFATKAITIGAHALSATGQATEARALERILADVGEKATASTAKAAEFTERAAKDAASTVAKAAADAKKAITEADATSRREITRAVIQTRDDLGREMQRIFGGESPEVVERMRPLLDKFGSDLDSRVKTSTADLLATVAKQFDPSDPTSPMAKHAASLEVRHTELSELIGTNHSALSQKVDELATALKVQEAKAALAKVTPIKGAAYENDLEAILVGIAAGAGDEYTDTRNTVGFESRSKKGDGVLTIGGETRVVVEMTDSARTDWTAYFEEAERNRRASAALGLVRTSEQNAGQSIRVLGPRRIVLAFDPAADDPDLLRTVVLLLRAAAIASGSRQGAERLDTVEEKITQARVQLAKIEDVKKTAGLIHKNATKIESGCTEVYSGIHKLLDDALAALVTVDTPAGVAADGHSQGAA